MPVSLEGFRCYQDGIDKAWAHISLRDAGKDDTQVVDIRIYDDAEQPVADLDGLTVRRLPFAKVAPPLSSRRRFVLSGGLAEERAGDR